MPIYLIFVYPGIYVHIAYLNAYLNYITFLSAHFC